MSDALVSTTPTPRPYGRRLDGLWRLRGAVQMAGDKDEAEGPKRDPGDALEPAMAPAVSVATNVVRDGRLVQAALEDPSEYRHLVELYQQRVYATSLRISGNPSDANDAAQEAFLRAFQNLHRFELGRSFGPWICTIAANVSRDQLRDPLRRLGRVGDWLTEREKHKSPARADLTVDVNEQRDLLAGALMKLKPKVREAVVLRFVSGLSIEETAAALDIGESAAKMRIKRGLAQLREVVDTDALKDALS